MNALEVSQRALDAWNRHDANAYLAVYAEGGTYENPRMDHPLKGQAIADFAKLVWTVFPDASLEIISRGATGGAWSPANWCYTAPTLVRILTAPRLLAAPPPIRCYLHSG